MKPQLSFSDTSSGPQLSITGSWRIMELTDVPGLPGRITGSALTLRGEALEEIDTAGALALFQALKTAGVETRNVTFSGLKPGHQNILALVQNCLEDIKETNAPVPASLLESLGRMTLEWMKYLVGLIAFFGETLSNFFAAIMRPRLFRPRELFVQLELVCLNAIPIAAMVTFLIGLVFAYLFADQSTRYGANIFIVDAVSIAMCRELSPIIVAIIMAGRSGSAFTAQIGTMKLNEEIDALQVLGLSPSHVLVIPRVLALILAMPLLVFVGAAVGIAAGALVANLYLGITPTTFIDRLQAVLPMRHVVIGLIKAPIFAFFIATIGCHMGLTVENNARSVGLHTTSTVVQGIVSVILLNAAFAVLLVELNL